MYKVIGSPKTRAIRVLWLLEEIEEDYELVPAGPRSAEVTALDPAGKVPLLVDGSAVLRDSVAICTYLADKHGACTHPAGTLERAAQDAMTQFCVDEVEGALWTLAKNSFVNPEEHRCSDIRSVCAYEFSRAMHRLETFLADQDFAAGDRLTVPDILLGHCAGWAANAKMMIPEGTVADYFTRMRARPSLARAIARGAEATA